MQKNAKSPVEELDKKGHHEHVKKLVPPRRFELLAPGLGNLCSIRLS